MARVVTALQSKLAERVSSSEADRLVILQRVSRATIAGFERAMDTITDSLGANWDGRIRQTECPTMSDKKQIAIAVQFKDGTVADCLVWARDAAPIDYFISRLDGAKLECDGVHTSGEKSGMRYASEKGKVKRIR
jgi:hypothetical protein